MLQFVFKLSQVLNNTLALFALVLVGLVTHSAMQVVNRTSLFNTKVSFHPQPFHSALYSYQNHRPSVMSRHIGEARLVGGKVCRYDVMAGLALAIFFFPATAGRGRKH